MAENLIWSNIEAFAVFCICVANKRGPATERKVLELLGPCDGEPFDYLRGLADAGRLKERLREVRTGQYERIGRALRVLVRSGIDLRRCSLDMLEAIPGIGPKTARYFLLRTRTDAQYAALDTHVLHWLRDMGYDVPRNTPQSKRRYRHAESLFLTEAERLHLKPSALDAAIWESYARAAAT